MNFAAVDHVNQLLSQFGEISGMSGLQLSEEGTFAFDHEEGLSIALELSTGGETLHWYSSLCEIPASDREAFFAQLLELNLLGIETRNTILGIDQLQNAVVVSYSVEAANLDSHGFNNVMENFLVTAIDLQGRLKSSRHDENPNDSELPDPLAVLQFRA